MNRPVQWLFATLMCCLGLSDAMAALRPFSAEGEVYQSTSTRSANQTTRLRSATISARSLNTKPAPAVTLAAPAAKELQQLEQNNQRYRAFQIGIARKLTSIPPLTDWNWQEVPGGKAGKLIISSTEATRIRARLAIEQALPAGVEIRVYNPDNASEVQGPITNQDFQTQVDNQQTLWTASIANASMGIELFLPTAVALDAVSLRVPEISHILYDMKTGQLRTNGSLRFQSCDVSIACAPNEWQETAKSVARYLFTGIDGNSYLCTGTLLADLDFLTQEPYFLTAAHCVQDSAAAASTEYFWFYRENTCGAGDTSWTRQTGGAELLATQPNLDTTLLRLKTAPPAGAYLTGWTLDSLINNDQITGLHHGYGNPQQFSQGSFTTHTTLVIVNNGYNAYADPNGNFNQVSWSQGITAPGSSGSGLWKTNAGQAYLKGTLVGGTSSCDNPQGPDDYSRLERFFPYVKDWLGLPPMPAFLDNQLSPKALTDGILLSRYMDGLRGESLTQGLTNSNIDYTTLEQQLQAMMPRLDIDGNGQLEAATDGLMFTRYLMGLRGEKLYQDLNLSAPEPITPQGINEYLQFILDGH